MTRKRRFGDRNDGRKLRTLDPMSRIAVFIMKDRNDALNAFSDSVDTEQLDRYIQKKRAEGLKGFGLMHILIAAYVRTVSQRPGLNRFISGQTIYARNNIVIALTMKKKDGAECGRNRHQAGIRPGCNAGRSVPSLQ